MNFTIKKTEISKIDEYKNIEKFFHTFPEIEIVEESIGNTILQTYYHISPQNIRKFKLININNTNDNILKLFKALHDNELIHNYGNEKPVFIWSTSGSSGVAGTSGTSGSAGKKPFKKITKKFDPHKISKGLKMKKRFKI